MTSTARSSANKTFAIRFVAGVLCYGLAITLATLAEDWPVAAWIPALLVLPGVALMAWAQIEMYRSGDEFQRRKIAEAVLFGFVVSAALILAVGVLQFYILPQVNWIFAFSILMLTWALGSIIAAIRYR